MPNNKKNKTNNKAKNAKREEKRTADYSKKIIMDRLIFLPTTKQFFRNAYLNKRETIIRDMIMEDE